MVLVRDKTAVPYEDEVWTLEWIARSTDVRIVGGARSVQGDRDRLSFSIAVFRLSRLKGERFDGHDYVADVLQAGALAALLAQSLRIPSNGGT